MISIDKTRIITNHDIVRKDKAQEKRFIELGINASVNDLTISSEKIFIVDPCYLADFYNKNGLKEQFLKHRGVILCDFGGDVGGPILQTEEGGLFVPLVFDRIDSNGRPIFTSDNIEIPEGEIVIFPGLFCDSGSYIFLDYNQNFCRLFEQELNMQEGLYALINIPNGVYRIGYEQWDTDEKNPHESWRRNIIVFPLNKLI